jgi:hypothetical protein
MLEKDTYRLRFSQDPAGCRLEKSSRDQAKGESRFQSVRDRTGLLRVLPGNIHADLDVPEILLYPDGNVTQARWSFMDRQGRTMSIHVSSGDAGIRVEESGG